MALYRINEREMDGEAEGKTSKKKRQYLGKGKNRSLDKIMRKKGRKKKMKKEEKSEVEEVKEEILID